MRNTKHMGFFGELTDKCAPYIIAEVGVNHEGSIYQAKKLVELAREGGAHAVKFQSYKAATLASKDSPAYWDLKKEPTKSQHDLFKKYDSFNKEQYIELSDYCRKIGIELLSTPFDDESIEFLDPLVPFFKIASADITNLPFLRKIAQTRKPVVLSTGASTLLEIDLAVGTLFEYQCNDIALLHCILNYPTKDEDAHLGMISSLKEIYPEYVIGYSDHTLPDDKMTTLLSAYLLGAKVIEKHFTHDKTLPGNDHYHSMDVADLKKFMSTIKKIALLNGGEKIKKPIASEALSRRNARRSIVLKTDVSKGELLSDTNLTYKRPATGISPLYWDEVINKTVSRDLQADHILQWSDIM